jgi:hypothetical protein
MAVTANQLITRQEGQKQRYLVAGSTHLYQGTLAYVTGDGYADDDTATGGNKFAGIVVGEKDNTGAAGDLDCELWIDGVFELTGSSFSQADVGKDAYGSDNFTITTTYAAGAVRIGRVVEYVSATRLRVKIEPDAAGGSLVYAAIAGSAVITNTTTETAFDKSFTIEANSLRPGDVIRVRAQSTSVSTNGTDTLDIQLRLGTTDILATGAVDSANGDIQFIDADIVIRTIGGSGTMVAAGHTANGVPGTVTSKPKFMASTAIDTTADISVNVSATWSVANAGNQVRLDILNVEILRRS